MAFRFPAYTFEATVVGTLTVIVPPPGSVTGDVGLVPVKSAP
jgi:hypothetical protein